MKFLFILLCFIQIHAESNSLDSNLTVKELSFNCEIGQTHACLELAEIYRIKSNYQKASSFYEKACDLNDIYGCYNLGLIYEYGCGIEGVIDYEQALGLFSKACKLGEDNNGACKVAKKFKKRIEKENFYQNSKSEAYCKSLPLEIGGLD